MEKLPGFCIRLPRRAVCSSLKELYVKIGDRIFSNAGTYDRSAIYCGGSGGHAHTAVLFHFLSSIRCTVSDRKYS